MFRVLYRPSSANNKSYVENFQKLLFKINVVTDETFICGDFNKDIADLCLQYCDKMIRSFDFKVENTETTRVTNLTCNCIDHVVSKILKKVLTLKWTFSYH